MGRLTALPTRDPAMAALPAGHADDPFLGPEDVCGLVPGMTPKILENLRTQGKGPRFFKPSLKVVVYRRSDVIAWVESTTPTHWRAEQ